MKIKQLHLRNIASIERADIDFEHDKRDLIIDGFNKSVTKRDNQIVIKEDGKEVDYFLPKDFLYLFFW